MIGAPDPVGLHVARVVGARQRLALARRAAIPCENPAGGIKHLQKPIVLEIVYVEVIQRRAAGGRDGSQNVLSVGGNLGHEPHPIQAELAVLRRIPRDHILVPNRHLRLHFGQRVEPLVVLRAVHIHAHGLSVARKGMAIGAGMHVLKHNAAAGLGNIAQAPLDERDCARIERFDDAFSRIRGHQGDVAIENWSAQRIYGCLNLDLAQRNRVGPTQARDCDGCRSCNRVLLDGSPLIVAGNP